MPLDMDLITSRIKKNRQRETRVVIPRQEGNLRQFWCLWDGFLVKLID